MEVSRTHALVINAPEFFRDPQFEAWLNNGETKFTWHAEGKPHAGSDVVVLVDPALNGDGSDSDMPAHIWDRIVDECRDRFPADAGGYPIVVWLQNAG